MIERPEAPGRASSPRPAPTRSPSTPRRPPTSHRLVGAIHEAGCGAGVAINPGTPVEALAEVAADCDLLLCMSVNPGWGGQSFIAGLAREGRARSPRSAPTRRSRSTAGSTPTTAPARRRRRARAWFVAGSAIFGTADPAAAYARDRGAAVDALPSGHRSAAGAGASITPIASCSQARSCGRRRRPLGPLGAPAGQVAPAADGDQVGPGDREAAVDEHDDRRRRRRGGCAGSARPRRRRSRSGAPVSPSSGRVGRTEKICRRAAHPDRQRGRPARSAPRASVWISRPISLRVSRRTSRWSSSPASITVEPRGSSASPSRTIRLTSASRGSPSSLTMWPTTASASLDPEGEDVAAELLDHPRLDAAAGGGRARSVVSPSRCGQRLEREPLDQGRADDDEEDDVEEQLAALDAGDHRQGREPDRHRAAQARPSSASPARRSGSESTWVATRVAIGRATKISASASADPLERDVDRAALGKTSRPSRKKSEICATQLRPWWKAVTVRRAGRIPVPSARPVR